MNYKHYISKITSFSHFLLLILTAFVNFSCSSSAVTKNQSIDSEIAFTIPVDDFYPEGIAKDSKNNFYIGSLRYGTIYKAKIGDNKASEFIPANSGGLISVTGMIVDNKNNLWACSSDPGVSVYSKKDSVSLKKINLTNKKIEASYNLPKGGFCNDIAIDDKNNIYVTDSFNPRILILENGSSELKNFVTSAAFSGSGFNLNGITFDGKSSLFVVKYNSGKLFRISLADKSITEINMIRPLFAADGLKAISNGNLIVIEGGSVSDSALANGGSGRVTKIIVEKNNSAKLEILKEGLDVPTTFAISGNEIFVIESQYDHLFKYKSIKHNPFIVRKFSIKDHL
jgi:sugar lactone lactonase YvrE